MKAEQEAKLKAEQEEKERQVKEARARHQAELDATVKSFEKMREAEIVK